MSEQATQEQRDNRLLLLDSLLSSKGQQSARKEAHQKTLTQDPEFYGHLAAWYQKNGFVEDHRQLFIAHLSVSEQREHREAAFVMLQNLRTYQVAAIVRYLKEHVGKLPRRMRNAVEYWLRRREADSAWFDEVAMRDRKNLKYLYATLRLSPSPRAKAILFTREPPKESRLALVKELSQSRDTQKIAQEVVRHKINASTAVGLFPRLDEHTLEALIQVMTPQQLFARVASLRKRGAFDNKRLRALIEEKLLWAAKEKRVQDGRLLLAAKAAQDDLFSAQLGALSSERLLQKGRIQRPTAIFVDKSGSMQIALEVGRHVAALCSTIAEAGLWVYAFDAFARRIPTPPNADLIGWSSAFSPIKADGATSIGAPFALMQREKVVAEQIVVITDGEENTAPFFVEALRQYQSQMKTRCVVLLVLVGPRADAITPLEASLAGHHIGHSAVRFTGDLYSLPNLIPHLTAPRRADLGAEVMMTKLPTFEELKHLPPGFDPTTFEIL